VWPCWLDSNVFIESKNGPYPFDGAPGFWNGMVENAKCGRIRSPMMVYDELLKIDDELKEWSKKMNGLGFFIDPDEAVQRMFTVIADYVESNYDRPQAAWFLDKADPWLIAQAKAVGGTVVTREKLVGSDSRKVKVPNICQAFGVRFIDTFEMIRELGIILR
jgi:hypothetical protein